MPDLKQSLERYYLSMSIMELRQSESYGQAGRLPYNTVLYLDIISANPGCTVTFLSETLGITKATVTMTLNRLEDKDLVVRVRSEEDGRIRHMYLSDSMMREYEKYNGTMWEVADRLAGKYTPEEVDLLCRMLDDASEVMEELTPRGSGDDR